MVYVTKSDGAVVFVDIYSFYERGMAEMDEILDSAIFSYYLEEADPSIDGTFDECVAAMKELGVHAYIGYLKTSPEGERLEG